MHAPLNLPLPAAPTTRRAHRRVVAIGIAALGGVLLGFLAFRMPFAVATTLAMRPTDTAVSIRLLRTHANEEMIANHLDEMLPLEDVPSTLSQLLAMSNREATLHITQNGDVSLAIDAPLSTAMHAIMASFGYNVITQGTTSLITKATDTTGSWALVPSALLPWHDGEVRVFDGRTSAQGALRLTKNGVTIGMLTEAGGGTPAHIPKGTTIVFAGSIADAYFSYPAIAESLSALPTSHLLEAILDEGASIAVFHDEKGTGYFLSMSAKDLTVEEVAALGKDIIGRTSLSTQEWTSPDGESYSELRIDPLTIATDIRAEEDFTFITLSAGDERLRLTKTPDTLTISNRDITIDSTVEPQSTCLNNALFWMNSALFVEETHDEVQRDPLTRSLLRSFSEIAVNSHKIRFCW